MKIKNIVLSIIASLSIISCNNVGNGTTKPNINNNQDANELNSNYRACL